MHLYVVEWSPLGTRHALRVSNTAWLIYTVSYTISDAYVYSDRRTVLSVCIMVLLETRVVHVSDDLL